MVWSLVPRTSIRALEGHFVITLPRNARKLWWKLLGLCVHVHNCYKQCPTKLSKRPTKIEFVRTCVHAKPNSYFQHCTMLAYTNFNELTFVHKHINTVTTTVTVKVATVAGDDT